MYKIREVRSEDFSVIAAIHDDQRHIHLQMEAPLDEQKFNSVLSNDDIKMYIVEKSEVVIAFILFIVDQDQITIEKFSIDIAYRKKGVDEHLYHKVERYALRTGIKRMVTRIKIDDPDVYDFFHRKGWQQTEEKNQYEIEF